MLCIHKGLVLKLKLITSGVMQSNIRNKSELPAKVMKINIMITKGLKSYIFDRKCLEISVVDLNVA